MSLVLDDSMPYEATSSFHEQSLLDPVFWSNAHSQRGQHSVKVHHTGADPWALSHEGKIYYTHTTARDIKIWVADSLEGLAQVQPHVVWKPGKADKAVSKNIWAPEIHCIGGIWYIYFAADDGRNHNHRMYVLESKTGPLGPYELKGKLALPGHDRWAIDGTVVEINNQLYFCWSGWPGKKNGRQNLYLAKMDDPCTLSGDISLISQPQYSWESWVNEGPQFIQRDGKTFLIYSANRSWTDHYQLGMLELEPGSDPLERHSWRKHAAPVFQSISHGQEQIYAPGHCSFIADELGRDWIVYHVAKKKGSGWKREVRAQEWRWAREGRPFFGRPLPLPCPSTVVQKVEAEVPAAEIVAA